MRIFHNVTEADRRLWKAPLVSQLFPFLWAEPHHASVSLFRYAGHGRMTIPQVALGSLHESLAFLGHGVQFPLARCISNVSDCFIQLSTNHESLSQPIMKIGY